MEANKGAVKKMPLEKKTALKGRTIPTVRQTLTSYKRMHIANPLLKYQEAGIDVDEIIAQKSSSNTLKTGLLTTESKISTTLDNKRSNEVKKLPGKPLVRTQSLKMPKSNGTVSSFKKPTNMPGNQQINHNFEKATANKSNVPSNITKPKQESVSKYMPPTKPENRRPRVEIKAKVNSFPKGTSKPKPKHDIEPSGKESQSTLRRSLSSGQLHLKQEVSFKPAGMFNKMNHSQSDEQLVIPVSAGFKEFSPIMEENKIDRNFVFKTPSAYDRRSICHHTPHSARQSNLFHASTPAPIQMQKLQERLNRWLISRGKPPASFHHLRVFDSSTIKELSQKIVIDTENKENIEVNNGTSESYEDLKIAITNPEKKQEDLVPENQMSEEELAKTAKEAMADLLKLIGEDYPREQCLGWLELIRDKYTKIDEEPEYWECRAAIEQSAGNVHNAVEFYKNAIIQGAEVNSVDKSLDQLLKKFSLLSISPSQAQQKGKHLSDKERIVREARNVFKSTIIQFAIRERNIKKSSDDTTSQASSKKLVAIPVRRSTRLSRSAYTNTSGVKLCTSLKELSPSEDVSFQKNTALC